MGITSTKDDLISMTHETVFSLIQCHGNTVSFPDPEHVQYMLASFGINRNITKNSWIYKFCAIHWETSYWAVMEN